MLDLRGTIPVFTAITTGDIPDNKPLGAIALSASAIVVLDRQYMDFNRLYTIGEKQTVLSGASQ